MTCYGKTNLQWSEPLVLCPSEIAGVPAGVSGVYVLLAFSPMCPTLIPFYVGQSSDLRRRLAEHLRSRDPIISTLPRELSTYVALARVDDTPTRLAVESALIAREQPASNERIPGSPTIEVNGPPTSLIE